MIGTVTNTPKRFYYLKDHLGSIRAVVDENGDIVSSDDYDPWSMILNGRSTDIAYLNSKYKFTGKELDTETGYDYFGARYYDGRIGRWLQTDPLAGESPEVSPYIYANDNPITIADFFGMDTTYFAQMQPVVITPQKENNVQQAQVVPVQLPEPLPLPIPTPMPRNFDRPHVNANELFREFNYLIENFPIAVGTPYGPAGVINVNNLFTENKRNPAQDKKLTPGEIKKLIDHGYNAEQLKGGRGTGKTDIYKDKKGNLYIKPKGGSGPGEALGININKL